MIGTSAGAQIFIRESTTDPWVAIGEVEDIGEIGPVWGTYAKTSFNARNTEHYKTVPSGQVLTVSMGLDVTDEGQDMVRQAQRSPNRYSFRVVLDDALTLDQTGTQFIFEGLVLRAPVAIGSADNIVRQPVEIQMTGQFTEIPRG